MEDDPVVVEPDEDESLLLTRLREGDEDSYAELVRSHGGRMYAVALRLTTNAEDARDAVQQAFLQAFKHIDAFEGRSSLGTWLHRIAVNEALQLLRSRRRREQSVDELLPRFDALGCRVEPRGRVPPTEALVERHEARIQVRRCIERLPDVFRIVLVLRDIEGFSTGETAEMLGITDGAVKMRLHRARSALKKLLEPVLRGCSS